MSTTSRSTAGFGKRPPRNAFAEQVKRERAADRQADLWLAQRNGEGLDLPKLGHVPIPWRAGRRKAQRKAKS